MLLVDVRDLNRGPVETRGRLEPDDPSFSGLDLGLAAPVEISGRLSRTGEQEYFWHARLSGCVRGACRRCLTEVVYPFDVDVEVLFSADPENPDPSVFPLTAPVTRVDVRPAVREEVALAVSAFPLCREDCAGLCPRCGADLNAGPCPCRSRPNPD
jgi:uncharacterized protein